MTRKGKLELTWVNKDARTRLEPRILVEDKGLSHGDPRTRNMLIHGDNLLALKALEQDFAGEIKCIYIDPPFNTKQAFEHYDDGLEHSIWLTLMRDRLELLHSLLHDSGTLFIHIDDNELAYLTVLADEIFIRKNRVAICTFKQSSTSGPKAINPGMVTTSNFILVYAKDKSQWQPQKVFVPTKRDDRYNSYITNYSEDYSHWKFETLRSAFATVQGIPVSRLRREFGDSLEERLEAFVLENAERVIRLARVAPEDVNADARIFLEQSYQVPDKVFKATREERDDYYFVNGQQLLFYSSKVKEIDGKLVTGQALSTIWDDLLSNNLHNEGGVNFPKGKKPEMLIKRVLELSTKPGDWVLDSFAGSGTTAAVAHKMGRNWITVEMGEQAHTHCLPRLKRVVDGNDPSGVTAAVKWQGGGGFKFYRLAETLLIKDPDVGTFDTNPSYTREMLCEAICKIENFKYEPRGLWHGYSSEKRFIHIALEMLNQPALDLLEQELSPDESLLIYYKKMVSTLHHSGRVELKRIPRDLQAKCDFEVGV